MTRDNLPKQMGFTVDEQAVGTIFTASYAVLEVIHIFYFKFLQRTVYFGGNIWRKPILNSLSADEVDNLTARLQSVGLSSSVSL